MTSGSENKNPAVDTFTSKLNICRPGYSASCALCCGSHNYDASPMEIEELFARRRKVFRYYSRKYIIKQITSSRSPLTGSYYYTERKHPFTLSMPPVHSDSLQCPYVTFIDDNITAGCFLYPEQDHASQSRECFNAYRSRHFTCAAKEKLSDKEIIFAARLTGDWYFYPILIHHHSLLRQLMKKYNDPDNIEENVMNDISSMLKKYLLENKALFSIHTYFE